MITRLLLELAASFTAGVAYGTLFGVPRKALLAGGFTGFFGWLFYGLSLRVWGLSSVAASFIGSLAVGTASEILARVMRRPTTVFIVPGIIPLVPGLDAYMTMLLFLQGRVQAGITRAIQMTLIAGGIASGLIVAGSIFRALKRRKKPAGGVSVSSRPYGN